MPLPHYADIMHGGAVSRGCATVIKLPRVRGEIIIGNLLGVVGDCATIRPAPSNCPGDEYRTSAAGGVVAVYCTVQSIVSSQTPTFLFS